LEKETLLRRSDSAYAPALGQYLGDSAPSSFAALGNLDAIRHKKLVSWNQSSFKKVIGLLAVMPAKAGIQTSSKFLDSGSR